LLHPHGRCGAHPPPLIHNEVWIFGALVITSGSWGRGIANAFNATRPAFTAHGHPLKSTVGDRPRNVVMSQKKNYEERKKKKKKKKQKTTVLDSLAHVLGSSTRKGCQPAQVTDWQIAFGNSGCAKRHHTGPHPLSLLQCGPKSSARHLAVGALNFSPPAWAFRANTTSVQWRLIGHEAQLFAEISALTATTPSPRPLYKQRIDFRILAASGGLPGTRAPEGSAQPL